MPGQRRRPANALTGHRPNNQAAIVRLVPRADDPPLPARGWLKITKNEWSDFWKSDISGQVTPEAEPAARDMFEAQDELWRALRLWKREPMVPGSRNQPVLNPIRTHIMALRDYLLKARREFGLTPLARVRLGWGIADGVSARERMNQMLDSDFDEECEEDVRMSI